jgi:hypothetical protein
MSQRLARHCGTPAFWRHVHLAMMGVWLALVLPTLLWWKDSILWVLLISIYANVVGHFGAWQAARAEEESASGPGGE